MIHGISYHGRHFLIILHKLEIYCQDKFKELKSAKHLNFFAYRVIYFWNNQVKNNNRVEHFKIE